MFPPVVVVPSPTTLISPRPVVFSKRAALRASVEANDARRDQRVIGRRRKPGAVGSRRDPECPSETGGKRPHALKPHREADVGHRSIRRSQQRCGPFESSRQQVGVRGDAEGPAKLTAEVRARQPRHARELVDIKPLGVPRVREVLSAEEMPGGRDETHAAQRTPVQPAPAPDQADGEGTAATFASSASAGCLSAPSARTPVPRRGAATAPTRRLPQAFSPSWCSCDTRCG